jgi:hypothetical protein
MPETILVGRGQEILAIPQATWKQHLLQIPQHSQARLNFMTDVHHQIRYFVVREMARKQEPIKPETISEELDLPFQVVETVLDELEKRLFFLVRNEQGAVAWAFPVTIEITPHKLDFRSGERLYAA